MFTSIFILTIIIISFLIGERANFIRVFFSIALFTPIIATIKTGFYEKILTFIKYYLLSPQ